jgi:galacturan 1,4-alpha-galacturonidase
VIQHSHVQNGDDCVSFKPNSTNIVVQGLRCSGSHGISVGSLGQYADEVDVVENVYVSNVSMADASDVARIKVWPGAQTSFQPTLNGGGGRGWVRNVTYDGMRSENSDLVVQLTQCYGESSQAVCNQHPVSDCSRLGSSGANETGNSRR